MKKLFIYLFAVTAFSITACKGTGKTGGDQPDSGQTNVGSSGASDTTRDAATSAPAQNGTSGTDTSTNGKGVATPTTDTVKHNPQ